MLFKFSFIEKWLLRRNIIPHPLVDGMVNLLAGRALHLGVKLGIIDLLEKQSLSPAAIAREKNLNEEGVRLVLDCLQALDYLQEKKGCYQLNRRGRKFLSRESPAKLRQMILLADDLQQNFLELDQALTWKGAADSREMIFSTFSEAQWEVFSEAMLEIARISAGEISTKIPLPGTARRMLDLGGSHGLYSIRLCQRHSELTAEIMDLPAVEAFAKRVIEAHDLSERVKFRCGDFLQDDLGEGYDAILAFNIVHGFSPAENAALTARVHQALNPGGIYVILEQIRDISPRSHLAGLITAGMGLLMFLQTRGRSYAFQEVQQWADEAGFSKCQLKKLRVPGFGLIIASKES